MVRQSDQVTRAGGEGTAKVLYDAAGAFGELDAHHVAPWMPDHDGGDALEGAVRGTIVADHDLVDGEVLVEDAE